MNWIDPKKELPKQNDIIWILIEHWKKEGSLSCEIYSGRVEVSNGIVVVHNPDSTGRGWLTWSINDEYEYNGFVKAWLPVNELTIPSF